MRALNRAIPWALGIAYFAGAILLGIDASRTGSQAEYWFAAFAGIVAAIAFGMGGFGDD